MSIPNQKAALDTIKLTKSDKVKLNKIIKELSDLNTELERLGIIQKYEFTQYYKGVFNIFKWIGDFIKYQLGFKKPTPLSRWYNWQKDHNSTNPLEINPKVNKIINGPKSISEQINDLESNGLNHDYREVLYGCLKMVNNIPPEIIKAIGMYDNQSSGPFSKVDQIELSTQSVFVKDRKAKSGLRCLSDLNQYGTQKISWIELHHMKTDLKTTIEQLKEDFDSNESKKSKLYEIHKGTSKFSQSK